MDNLRAEVASRKSSTASTPVQSPKPAPRPSAELKRRKFSKGDRAKTVDQDSPVRKGRYTDEKALAMFQRRKDEADACVLEAVGNADANTNLRVGARIWTGQSGKVGFRGRQLTGKLNK